MKQSFRMQISLFKDSNPVKIVFWVLMLFVAWHYVGNVMLFRNRDVTNMYHPMLITLLSDEIAGNEELQYLLQMLPFLVVIPAAFSFIDDRNSGETVYVRTRLSASQYMWGKAAAVFFITFVTFEIPLLTELFLNCIAFPLSATGSPTGVSLYEDDRMQEISSYLWHTLFIKAPYFYTVVMTLKFSLFCAVMALFSFAVSTMGFRIKVFLFLPVYVILYVLAYLKYFVNISYQTNYFFYLKIFNNQTMNNWTAFWLFLFVLTFISAVLIFRYSKKDCLG